MFGKILFFCVFAVLVFSGQSLAKKMPNGSRYYSRSANIKPKEEPIPGFDTKKIQQAWKIIKKSFYKEADPDNMMDWIMRGMAASLQDKYSRYMTKEEFKKFMDFSSLIGIGIYPKETKEGNLQVKGIEPGGPADIAGIKRDDIIIIINGVFVRSVHGMEKRKLLRGKAGTLVFLTIMREGRIMTVKIRRAVIKVKNVFWGMYSDRGIPDRRGKIGYLSIAHFMERSLKDMRNAAMAIARNHPKGIILDLRGNPGGYLRTAVRAACLWLDGKLIVRQILPKPNAYNKDENKTHCKTHPLRGIPLIILVNRSTASAAEILAGSLRYYGAGKLLGERTYGKGSVQANFRLYDGSILKLTIGKWVFPDGTYIQDKGIQPDIPLKLTKEDRNNGRDTQLEKAIEILNK